MEAYLIKDSNYDIHFDLCYMITNYYNVGSVEDIKRYAKYLHESLMYALTIYTDLYKIKKVSEFDKRFTSMDKPTNYEKESYEMLEGHETHFVSHYRYFNISKLWNALVSNKRDIAGDLETVSARQKVHNRSLDNLIKYNTLQNRRMFVMEYLYTFTSLVQLSCPGGSNLSDNTKWLRKENQLNVALIPNIMGVIGINSHLYCLMNKVIPLVFSVEHAHYRCQDERPIYLKSGGLKEWPGFLLIDGCMNCPGENLSVKIAQISKYTKILQSDEIIPYNKIYNYLLHSDIPLDIKKVIMSSLLYSLYNFGISISDIIRFRYDKRSSSKIYFGVSPAVSSLIPLVEGYKQVVKGNTSDPTLLSAYDTVKVDTIRKRMGISLIFTVDYIRNNLFEMDIIPYLMKPCPA